MNEEKFERGIEERWARWEHKRKRGRIWTGLFLLVIGLLLLAKTANLVLFPSWFFTWPVLLIAIGLFSGLRHRFRGGFWFVFLLVGGLSLADQIDPTMNMDRYIWPIVFISIGLIFLMRPRKRRWRHWRDGNDRDWSEGVNEGTPTRPPGPYDSHTSDSRDFVDITAVFGGIKKNVLSKTFKGGDIVSFMGGSEIDLTQADFSGRVKVDVTNIFGGTKLLVPSSWDVHSDVTTIFGGVDDKRQIGGVQIDQNKVLILDGTCLFGGIEIRSF